MQQHEVETGWRSLPLLATIRNDLIRTKAQAPPRPQRRFIFQLRDARQGFKTRISKESTSLRNLLSDIRRVHLSLSLCLSLALSPLDFRYIIKSYISLASPLVSRLNVLQKRAGPRHVRFRRIPFCWDNMLYRVATRLLYFTTSTLHTRSVWKQFWDV